MVDDYESRIAELECEVTQLMALSKSPTILDSGRVQQLEAEKEMLVQALEILGERSFTTKLMYQRQMRGE